ncbi:hypothetical protein [Haloplanus halophilus]|uniref:hypothetical protein n=1 Tax=Haloplanus halophilus TaxID=2949993 RepID=UPI00203C102A|nr:hypothetical protein [Haloplanus sp. GDY1]
MTPSLHLDTIPSPLTVGGTAGIVHAGIAALLWTYFGFEDLLATAATEPLYVGYVVLGMVLLGSVPGILYVRFDTVSPPLLVGSLLTLSTGLTWRTHRTSATPVDPTPFGWYVLLWIGIVAVAGLVGGIETTLRHRSATT